MIYLQKESSLCSLAMPRFSRQQYDWFFHEADVTGKGHLSLSDLGNVLAHFSYSINGATLKVFKAVTGMRTNVFKY
jgi:hypothetical protein